MLRLLQITLNRAGFFYQRIAVSVLNPFFKITKDMFATSEEEEFIYI
jgi:hypothetical protein